MAPRLRQRDKPSAFWSFRGIYNRHSSCTPSWTEGRLNVNVGDGRCMTVLLWHQVEDMSLVNIAGTVELSGGGYVRVRVVKRLRRLFFGGYT